MKRILIVEDEYFLAADCVMELDRLAMLAVGPADSEAGALALLEHGPIDGAIINVGLQGRPSFVVADRLVSRGIPFVFYTGYDRAFLPLRFAKIACVAKPETARRVVSTLLAAMPAG